MSYLSKFATTHGGRVYCLMQQNFSAVEIAQLLEEPRERVYGFITRYEKHFSDPTFLVEIGADAALDWGAASDLAPPPALESGLL